MVSDMPPGFFSAIHSRTRAALFEWTMSKKIGFASALLVLDLRHELNIDMVCLLFAHAQTIVLCIRYQNAHIRLQGFKTDTRLLSYLAPRLEPIKLFSLLNYVRRSHFSAQANIETAV